MKNQTKDMTTGNATKQIFLFALPLMFGNILQQLYTTVDTIIVGRKIGVHALAAIGATDWLNWMVLSTVIGFCQGFSILMSHYFGSEKYDKLKKSISMSIIIASIISILATIIFVPSTKSLLIMLNTPKNVLNEATNYLRIIFLGTSVVAAYNILSSILRSLGNSKTPLFAMATASIINIILDILFVVVFNFGISGAAIATVIAQFISCFICLNSIRKIPILKMNKSDWIIDKHIILKLIKLGTPMAFQNTIISIGGIIVQYVINGFGVVFVAAYTTVMKLYGLLELAATSFGFSMATFTGQNMGAKNYKRIKKGMNSALKMAIATSIVMSILIIVFGKYIVMLFVSGTTQEANEVIKLSHMYLLIMGSFLFILYLLYVYRSAVQGMGDTVTPMISGIVELIMRVAAVLIIPIFIGQNGIFFAEVIAWLGSEILLMITYYYKLNKYLNGDI